MNICVPKTTRKTQFWQLLGFIVLLTTAGFSAATPINIGDVITDSIDAAAEVDEFEFTANSGDTLFFDSQSGSVSVFAWQLTTPSGTDTFSNNGFADNGPLTLSESGEYRLSIFSRHGNLGAYRFQIVNVPDISSTAINLNEMIEGEIVVQGETDEFIFSLATEQTLYFDKLTGPVATKWSLTDTFGNHIFDTNFVDVQALVVPAGDYRLSINGNGDNTFAYSFIVVAVPPVSRTPIDINDVIAGEIAVQGEIDEYLITLSQSTPLYFDRQTGNQTQISWALTDQNGQEIFNNTFWNDVEFGVLEAGEYVLSIDGRNENTLVYQFQIVEIPAVSSTVINLNDVVEASISLQGEKDEFTFSVPSTLEVYFDRQAGTSSALNWSLNNSEGEEIFNDPYWGDIEPIVLEAGNYTLNIDGVGDNRLDYQFQLHIVPDTITSEADIYLGSVGELTVPGQRHRFEYEINEPALLGVERIGGAFGGAFKWTMFDTNDAVVASNASFVSATADTLINITTPGTYTLEFDGNGDDIGKIILRMWRVDQPAPVTIALDTIVSVRLSSQGQTREYSFDATEGEPLYLNVDHRQHPRIWFNLYAPDGRRLLANRTDDATIASLTQTGTYKLIARNSTANSAIPTGNHSFIVSQSNDDFVVQNAAELHITSASTNYIATDDPANIEISYTVTNNGSAQTNATVWKDRIQFFTDNEFKLTANNVSVPIDFTIPIEVTHNGVLAPAESYTNTLTLPYPSLDQTIESFEIVIEADVENQVYEATSELNRHHIVPRVLLHEARQSAGGGAITTNLADGTILPSNTPIALSGKANLSGGTVNAYFVIDNSASTGNPFNFDANGDGTVDESDDFNGDGRNGDVLDVEISSILTIAKQMEQNADDALVSVIPFNATASLLDLGPERMMQPFIAPGQQSFSASDNNLAYALKNNMPRVYGTNFAPPISELLHLASVAPKSDQNFVFFLTDGQASDTVSQEELQALGELGITLFAFQINNNTITTSLQTIVDAIDGHPNSTAIGQSVVNPGDLPNLVLQSLALESVEVNGVEAEAIDAAGNYFSTITLNEGPNLFTIAALDSERNGVQKQVTLIGAAVDNGGSSSLVPSQGQLIYNNVFFNRSTNRLLVDAKLQNNGSLPMVKPVTIHLQTDPVAVTVDNADGHDENGQSIVLFGDELGTGINTGETSTAKNLIFSNQRRDRFSVLTQPLTRANSAPYFSSTPPVNMSEGGSYVYAANATDDDGDALIYGLALAPQGMNINSQTGQISWTPTPTQTGTHFVSIRVSDEKGGITEQGYQLSVTNAVANLPPFITSTPLSSIISTQAYQYQLVAIDPEGHSLTYSLDTAPAGVSINPSTGLISAASGSITDTNATFAVTVVDALGGQAQQSWTSTVKGENQTPAITSNPLEITSADTRYTYRVEVDDDDAALHYALTAAPVGMSINAVTGVISMFPTSAQIGAHVVSVRVTDPFAATDVQHYSLVVAEDAEPPKVSIILTASQIALGDSTLVSVVASDNAGIGDISLVLNGAEQALDSNNSAIIAPSQAGEFTLTVTVTDINNIVTQESATLRVIDPTDSLPPIVSILSPEPRSTASFLTDIVGTVEADDLYSYKLQHALASEIDVAEIAHDGPQWTTFSQGSENVNAALLGVFDPTILRNDDYVVRLLAQDINGNQSAAAVYIGVTGEAKIGVFQLTYTDLAVPVSNIPIEINRIYNTTNAAIDGDLGYGWHLQFSNPDIRETVPLANMEQILGIFVNNAYTGNTRVYLNAPDGKRIGFTFEPEPVTTMLGNSFIPKFVADPGVFYELEVDPVTISQSQDGSFTLFLVPFNYNPQDFRLIEPNGTTWQYNQFTGLEKVSDRQGNELVYTHEGIFHSSGVSVTFERDNEGRITSITDPSGNQLHYHFNANGELTTFTDQTGGVERFAYLDTPQHFLHQITDANGNTSTIEFDENGRVAGSIDGLGVRISQDWDPEGFTGTITDAKGQITQLHYDISGNIVREQDPNGGTTLYSYDDDNNVTSIVDENGNTTTYTFDNAGNVISEIDALGNTTQYGFDAFDNRISVINALGVQSTSTYDENGNLSQVTLPDGSQVSYIFDARGRILSMTDAEGNQTSYEYSGSFTSPVKINLPDGNSQTRTINSMGLIDTLTDELGNRIELLRDAKGRIIEQSDANNHTYIYQYSGNLLSAVTDPSGKSKFFTYDAKEQLISTQFSDTSLITYSYDVNGNLTSVKDAADNTTTYTYDELDRRISRVDATGATETYQYDNAGNLTTKVDRRGYTVNYQYDSLHRMLSETWLDNTAAQVWQMNNRYDALGNVLSMDDGFSEIVNTYDVNNRIVTQQLNIASGPSSALSYTYDGNDKLVEVSDASSTQSVSYNSRSLVEALTLSADSVSLSAELAYDPRGLRASMTRKQDENHLGTSTYGFDLRHLAQGITHELNSVNYVFDYVWDENRRVSAQTQNSELISYVYDDFDQLSDVTRSELPNESYTFDANGNPTSGATTGTGNRLLSAGNIEYRYDAAGNMVSRTHTDSGESVEFTYDHRNRLINIQRFDASDTLLTDISYGYDPLDRRVKRSINDQDEYTNYVFEDAWTDMHASGDVTKRYLNGANTDEKVARIVNGQAAWYLTDKQQTVYSIVDSNGITLNEFEYDSFGKVLSETNPLDADRFAYTGRELNREIGVYDYRSRTYDPTAKKFYSEDPIEFAANDANLYRYVFNNPLQSTDPSGELAAVEYGQILCQIVVPQVGHYKVLGSCLEEMYQGIADSVKSATANDGLAGAFGNCVAQGLLGNVINNAGEYVNEAGALVGGAYNSMFPPGGNEDGSDSSPGDVAIALACAAL